ncbi:MAG: pilin [Patescibacteria group bacterium]|nr:pilin [Patescibacteria group bacterium]
MWNKITIYFLILLSIFILSAQISYADCSNTSQGNNTNTVCLPNPLTGNNSSKAVPEFLGQIINYAMGIIGSLALVMFIYGGAVWMLSRGNQEQVAQGKNIIIWAAMGLAIIFMSYALIRFIFTVISAST